MIANKVEKQHTDNFKQVSKVSISEKILIAALVFSPFTALRFSFLGIAECLFILLGLTIVLKEKSNLKFRVKSITSNYFMFIVLCLLGFCYNYLTGINSGSFDSAVFNLLSYCFVVFAMFTIEYYLSNNSSDLRPDIVLGVFFIVFSILVLILYAISRFRSSLFGYSLTYYEYFCPLSNNLHQLAMVMGPLPFIGLYMSHRSVEKRNKIILILLAIIDVYIGHKTGAEKFNMGIVAGICILIVSYLIKIINNKKIWMAIVFLVAMMLIILWEPLVNYCSVFFDENDVNGGRQYLYKSAFEIIINKSPIIGLGPSNHVVMHGGYFDTHETFLSAALAAGVLGVFQIVICIWKMIKKAKSNCFTIAAMLPILTYALGGDILRKPSLWSIMMMLAFMGDIINQKTSDSNSNLPYTINERKNTNEVFN